VYSFDLAKLAPHAERIGPTPRDFGQITDEDPTGDRLVQRWASTKAVGRHWLTDHDFPLLDL
jgi:hypothetical protein